MQSLPWSWGTQCRWRSQSSGYFYRRRCTSNIQKTLWHWEILKINTFRTVMLYNKTISIWIHVFSVVSILNLLLTSPNPEIWYCRIHLQSYPRLISVWWWVQPRTKFSGILCEIWLSSMMSLFNCQSNSTAKFKIFPRI